MAICHKIVGDIPYKAYIHFLFYYSLLLKLALTVSWRRILTKSMRSARTAYLQSIIDWLIVFAYIMYTRLQAYTPWCYSYHRPVMWIRIRIHLGPLIRIQIANTDPVVENQKESLKDDWNHFDDFIGLDPDWIRIRIHQILWIRQDPDSFGFVDLAPDSESGYRGIKWEWKFKRGLKSFW